MSDKSEKFFNQNIGDIAADILAFPPDTFKNYPSIQIRGNREIIIEGCRGLLSYDKEEITADTKYYKVKVSGKDLTLRNFSRKVISIRGFIREIAFTK